MTNSLDLRDQFAIAAMNALIPIQENGSDPINQLDLAWNAYLIADAMMRERSADYKVDSRYPDAKYIKLVDITPDAPPVLAEVSFECKEFELVERGDHEAEVNFNFRKSSSWEEYCTKKTLLKLVGDNGLVLKGVIRQIKEVTEAEKLIENEETVRIYFFTPYYFPYGGQMRIPAAKG